MVRPVIDVLDFSEFQLSLVVSGARPGWLLSEESKTEVDRVKRRILSAYSGVLRVVRVVVTDAPKMRTWMVVHSDSGITASDLRSHIQVAKALGIPCGNEDAWHSKSLCHSFAVVVAPIAEKCVRYADSRITHVITSFWCSEEAVGRRWCRRLVSSKAFRGAVSERLVPLGLSVRCVHAGPFE